MHATCNTIQDTNISRNFLSLSSSICSFIHTIKICCLFLSNLFWFELNFFFIRFLKILLKIEKFRTKLTNVLFSQKNIPFHIILFWTFFLFVLIDEPWIPFFYRNEESMKTKKRKKKTNNTRCAIDAISRFHFSILAVSIKISVKSQSNRKYTHIYKYWRKTEIFAVR